MTAAANLTEERALEIVGCAAMLEDGTWRVYDGGIEAVVMRMRQTLDAIVPERGASAAEWAAYDEMIDEIADLDVLRHAVKREAREATTAARALAAREAEKELDGEELEFWRQVIRGEAGFNGQPQALLRLLQVSDAGHLNRLRAAYPEAVAAVLEDRG